LISFRIHRINARFMREMKELEFDSLTPDQALRLRIYNIDTRYRDKMKRLGLSGFTPDRLVAMKILRVNNGLIDQLKEMDLNDIDMRDLLRERHGNNGNYWNNYDDEIWEALHNVVEDIVEMD